MPAPLPHARSALSAQLLTGSVVAAFVLAVYAAVVLGGGGILGAAAPSLPLAVVATAVVAVTLEPVRSRAHRHLVGSPYDELSAFSARVGAVVATEDVVPTIAQLLRRATAARCVEVWLVHDRAGQPESLAARSPAGAAPADRSAGDVVVHDVVLGDRVVGRLVRVESRALTPVEERLVRALSDSAGMALGTVVLTADLQHQVVEGTRRAEELQASRERIVTGSVDARRRLERDIHDGAQQHLVALAVNASLAATLVQHHPERAQDLLRDLPDAVAEALATLEDLSRGIYPRTLVDRGVAAALRAATATSPVRVVVTDDSGRRYAPPAEAAVYFVCLEAVQNALKHARAREVHVRLSTEPLRAAFAVSDDGVGFDASAVRASAGIVNMRDRVESLGGTMSVASAGSGTTVAGVVPIPPGSVCG